MDRSTLLRRLNTRRCRTPKQDVANIGLCAGSRWWNSIKSIAESGEQVPRILRCKRCLPDTYIVSETTRADVAPGSDVDNKVAPESHYVVLIISVAAILKREHNFSSADVSRQRGITECVVVVPDLHLLDLMKVVISIESHDFDVRLLEVAARSSTPCEPEPIGYARRADDSITRKATTTLTKPVLIVGR